MNQYLILCKDIAAILWNGSSLWTRELKAVWAVAKYIAIAWVAAALIWITFFRVEEPAEPYQREEVNFRTADDFFGAVADPSVAQRSIEAKTQENRRVRQRNADTTARNRQSLMSALTYTFGWPTAALGAIWGLFSLVVRKDENPKQGGQ